MKFDFQFKNDDLLSRTIDISSKALGIDIIHVAGARERASLSFLSILCSGISGTLHPSIYVSPLPTGFGKSTLVIAAIKASKEAGFKGAGGILIAVSTRKEIDAYIKRAGLAEGDYAVLFGFNDPANLKGRGANGRDDAPVLFTTHSMLRSRTMDGDFGEAKCFFYNGQPRSLRVCDEGIDIARSASIRLSRLMGAMAHIHLMTDGYAKALQSLVTTILNTPVGTIIDIPVMPSPGGFLLRDDDGEGGIDNPAGARLPKAYQDALRSLRDLSGHKVRIARAGKELLIYGYGKALPDDLAPLVMLDASAPARQTYPAWKEGRGNLVMLPGFEPDYSNLTIHLSVQPCGKAQLRLPEFREPLFRGLGKHIESLPGERFLIVHPIIPGLDVEQDIQDRVTDGDRVRAINWGQHKATNDFNEYENVILLGAGYYRQEDYVAMLVAASGEALDADDDRKGWTTVRRGELESNLIQAIGRVNVRNVIGGVCGKANAYLVLPKSVDPRGLLGSAFPGATILDWGLRKPELTGLAKKVAAKLVAMLRLAPRVTKKEIREPLGMSSQQLTPIWKKPLFVAYLREHGVEYIGRHFIRST
jgi:hypothetical protein